MILQNVQKIVSWRNISDICFADFRPSVSRENRSVLTTQFPELHPCPFTWKTLPPPEDTWNQKLSLCSFSCLKCHTEKLQTKPIHWRNSEAPRVALHLEIVDFCASSWFRRVSVKNCDSSCHLQESLGPPGPKSRKSLQKVFWGVTKKVPAPKSQKKGQKRDPPKRLFLRFLRDFGPRGPRDSCKWRLG